MDINSQYHNLLGNQILPKSEFLYFGGHFWFKMATIANENGRHMVQHVLLPVNIHFQSVGGHFEKKKKKEHNFE
jgi:hypothetical protein